MSRFEQRARAARQALELFATSHGWKLDDLKHRVEDIPGGKSWIYTAPDGREFACGAVE